LSFLKLSTRIITSVLFVLIIVSTSSNGQDQTEENSPTDSVFVMHKSPWGAVLRSAVLPGFGQFYNESYWKIPVIWGAGALLISGWVYNNNLYNDNKDLYTNTSQTIYQYRRDFYRNQRDNFTIYLVVLYILNLVDAYVDAHLYDFTVEEDMITGSSRFNFRFYF